ncbi:HD domain-containing protein [Paenibacillus thiaminolyticus]|uniref:HD domain-containing protein n=1 Tax=Paenibacillus thiaminolyticus TaxID=49283 RepID=A0AAP9E0X5_PANTH|nr:HD domain-containing protein [Paenibacillus thiaminolyticus]MCY9538696.1 HD domain-containing protein [Paenibacillus thiaminolyticus]MCY9604425.1 HD domain-containing protein [Paenibacillus thiaminolyticus]MCY9605589.1 HD domain-containing protein [Paenibacillus thiaminolyticus]MCY9616216.1 HD domain-containing protein [Paenibacillus thiaminolyticus]MCY9619293.1 HD domain-containing protein [Paenibacillus thiaminolyticus]
MTLIKQLTNQDDFIGFYLLKELEVKQTNGNPPKDYLDIVLCDATGQLPAKYWDASPTDKETFFPMGLVKVRGIVQTYRERLQVKILQIRPAKEEDGVTLTDFIRSAPIRPIDLIHAIKQAISSISDKEIRALVSFCVEKVEEKLMHYPAAKTHHHAYFAGLAYHMVRMLEIGDFLCRQRPFLNPDLLKAGIILHDIAKPEEMVAQLGIVSEYSVQGKLVGHISMASNWITEAALRLDIDLDSPKVLGLQHLVLSHHNLGEWGSPVQPQTPEAVALHHIDALDAKLQMVEDALDTTPETEEWTPFIRGLENKAIYRMKL